MRTFSSLRAFIAVAEAGSFAAAARRLSVTTGYVSKLVARLEAELNVQLLYRTTREMSLTDAGRFYRERVTRLIAEFDELHSQMGEFEGVRGQLKLSVPLSLSRYMQQEILHFASRYPALEVSVAYTDRLVNLVEDQVDAAIFVGHLPDSTMVTRKLNRCEIVTCASPGFVAAHGSPASPRDLHRFPMVINLDADHPFDWSYRDGGQAMRIRVDGRIRMGNAEACLDAAAEGMGVARAFDFQVLPYIRSGRLVALLPAYSDEVPVSIAYPQTRHLAVRVRAFIDYLVDRSEEEAKRWRAVRDQSEEWLPMIGF